MTKPIKGSCLCGKVQCTLHGPFQKFYQCYCDRCQKKTGSAFAALIFTTPENIEWHSGKDNIKRFDLPEAERFSNCFCVDCGSQVPYLSRDGSALVIPAGYLDEAPGIKPMANIFCEEKASWFDDGQQAKAFSKYPE